MEEKYIEAAEGQDAPENQPGAGKSRRAAVPQLVLKFH
jgi:hypothetical protein